MGFNHVFRLKTKRSNVTLRAFPIQRKRNGTKFNSNLTDAWPKSDVPRPLPDLNLVRITATSPPDPLPFHFESNRRCLPLLRYFPTSPTAMAAAAAAAPPASSSPPPPSAADEDGVGGAAAAAPPVSSSPLPPIAADGDDDGVGGGAVRCSSPTPAPRRRTSPNRSGGSSRKVSSLARSLPFDLAAVPSIATYTVRGSSAGGFASLLSAVVGEIEFAGTARCGLRFGIIGLFEGKKNSGGVPAAGSERCAIECVLSNPFVFLSCTELLPGGISLHFSCSRSLESDVWSELYLFTPSSMVDLVPLTM
jgi:hypothetical protein